MATDNSEIVEIHYNEELPTYCCSCGMFSEDFTTIKYHTQETQVVPGGSGFGAGLGCLLALLGPIGLILSLALHRKDNDPKLELKSTTHRFKIPQCRLCAADRKPSATDASTAQFVAVYVHPDFARRLQDLRRRD